MATATPPGMTPDAERLGSTLEASEGEQRLELTQKPRPMLEPRKGELYAAWVTKAGASTATGQPEKQVMLLRVLEVLHPSADDLPTNTLVRAEANVPFKGWLPLTGPASATFLVAKNDNGETLEHEALNQFLYWQKLKSESAKLGQKVPMERGQPQTWADINLVDKLTLLNTEVKSEMLTMLDQAKPLGLKAGNMKEDLRELSDKALAEAKDIAGRLLGKISSQAEEELAKTGSAAAASIPLVTRAFQEMKKATILIRQILAQALQDRETESRQMQMNAEMLATAMASKGMGGQQQHRQVRPGEQLRSRSASPASSKDEVDFRTVCGYWYRHEKGQSGRPCKKGNGCDLNHHMPGEQGFDEKKRKKDTGPETETSKRSRFGADR
ncbi:hypothetical protein COCOBI_02-6670 [Coccomyxa sp. Obi]|nr:hypothetical protein COCOBI_02-6670 [Coccomyxa sp. Obi]